MCRQKSFLIACSSAILSVIAFDGHGMAEAQNAAT
jgi:hypothetical protein